MSLNIFFFTFSKKSVFSQLAFSIGKRMNYFCTFAAVLKTLVYE